MNDVFQICRERVSAEMAARQYGVEVDSRGKMAHCPFHADRHPSLSFKSGRWHCFSCGRGGDAVDLTAQLFGLTPVEALERLDSDFGLGLTNYTRPTPEARREALERRETYRRFQEWQADLQRQLNAAIREGNLALRSLEDFSSLTDSQVFAIQNRERLEDISDTLAHGTMEEQMEIFRERKEVTALCRKILNSTKTRSMTA